MAFCALFLLVAIFQMINVMDANPACSESKKVGHCRATLPRWFYNQQTKQCEFFHYGGCDGNANNFISEKECQEACMGSVTGYSKRGDTIDHPGNGAPANSIFSMTSLLLAVFLAYVFGKYY